MVPTVQEVSWQEWEGDLESVILYLDLSNYSPPCCCSNIQGSFLCGVFPQGIPSVPNTYSGFVLDAFELWC